MPLKHEVVPVPEELDPDDDALFIPRRGRLAFGHGFSFSEVVFRAASMVSTSARPALLLACIVPEARGGFTVSSEAPRARTRRGPVPPLTRQRTADVRAPRSESRPRRRLPVAQAGSAVTAACCSWSDVLALPY